MLGLLQVFTALGWRLVLAATGEVELWSIFGVIVMLGSDAFAPLLLFPEQQLLLLLKALHPTHRMLALPLKLPDTLSLLFLLFLGFLPLDDLARTRILSAKEVLDVAGKYVLGTGPFPLALTDFVLQAFQLLV